ncbi:MAG: DUF4032 domain-containing protein, partial [Deltaproteobacteria bacterium]|nr:DUF4032 domain-containing protein [Deltaproteobacteria bacterium]
MTTPLGLIASALRPGHPDFLDLPWDRPLDTWDIKATPRFERLPLGISRHPVVFVNYGGNVYALKELPEGAAKREYALLREMADLALPVVRAAGHISARHATGKTSVL